MKLEVHKASDRGFANHGWLQASHSFSFANYYNPNKMNFGKLRVLNDDVIAPGMGFATHPHQHMEIITIPLSGALKHKDSMVEQWKEVLPNEVQVMSAGTGVFHSEMNASVKERLSLFQIWIEPNTMDVSPRYDQKTFNASDRDNKLQVLVSGFSSDDDNSLKIHQDVKLSRINLSKEKEFTYELASEKHGVYVMTIFGTLAIESEVLQTRDAVGVSMTNNFTITAQEDSEVLFIEVPMN